MTVKNLRFLVEGSNERALDSAKTTMQSRICPRDTGERGVEEGEGGGGREGEGGDHARNNAQRAFHSKISDSHPG